MIVDAAAAAVASGWAAPRTPPAPPLLSTLTGSAQRGNGILHNSLYAGVRLWNRVTMVKDPDTGKRISRPNPESEWERIEVPQLRIVSDEPWQIAQGTRRERVTPEIATKMRMPKRLLSGLLKCGACGAGMSTMGTDKTGRVRVRCSAALDTVEKLVVGSLVAKLRSHENLTTYIEAYQAERRRLIGDKAGRRIKLERDLEANKRQMDRVVGHLRDGVVEASLRKWPTRSRRSVSAASPSRLNWRSNRKPRRQ